MLVGPHVVLPTSNCGTMNANTNTNTVVFHKNIIFLKLTLHIFDIKKKYEYKLYFSSESPHSRVFLNQGGGKEPSVTINWTDK